MTSITLGTLIYGFFIDYLAGQKGLRPTSIRSYRDALRLFLLFVSADARRPVSQRQIEDLTFERVLGFLQHLETTRHNHVATRNQRLAGLRTFFEYVGRRLPEMLHVCERVAAIPTKRTPLPETRFLDREETATLFARLPREGRQANQDHALLLMLYNTGARVQEIADLRLEHVSHHLSMCACTAKETNGVPVRCGRRRRACSVSGSTNGVWSIRTPRCSRPRRAAR